MIDLLIILIGIKLEKGLYIQMTFYLKWMAFCGISVALLADLTVCVQKYFLCQCQ